MASRASIELCRAALAEALALLDRHGHPGAACYVAMAIDRFDEDFPPSPGEADEAAAAVLPR